MAVATPAQQVMTNVVGFFNPHPWGVVINISAVNVNLMIGPKQYVMSRDGVKINDPLLEAYTGQDMLAKETCKGGTPLVLFKRPDPMPVSGSNGVTTSADVVKNSRGIVQDSSFDKITENATPGSSNSAIKVYTTAEAVKRGVIKPLIVPGDTAPKETEGQPMHGESIPTIDSLTPREMKPSELKKAQAATPPMPKLPVPVVEEETTLSEGEIAEKTKDLLQSITPQKKKKEFVCRADNKVFSFRSQLAKHVKAKYPEREAELMEGY